MVSKKELITRVAEEADATQTETRVVLEAFVDVLKEIVGDEHEAVNFAGFGTFMPSVRKARKGRNPRTGKKIKIPESCSIRFKPSAGLKKYIKEAYAEQK